MGWFPLLRAVTSGALLRTLVDKAVFTVIISQPTYFFMQIFLARKVLKQNNIVTVTSL